MSKEVKNRRILLRPDVAARVSSQVGSLREKHCSVDASKLVNAIIEIFFDRHASKEEKVLEQLFFNKKAFIKDALSNAGSDRELETVLRDALKKVGGTKKKTPPPASDGSYC